MSKHTPGPWGLMPDNPLQITDMIGHCDPLYLAEINGNNRAVAEANARLIAAAPELLEALRAMVAACGPHDSGLPSEQARAALAKAEGK